MRDIANISDPATTFPSIRRDRLQTLQLNLGYLCNLACNHCHVEAGPKRTELMDWSTMAAALDFIDAHAIGTVDVTGGSPEMNPYFRDFMRAAHDRGVHLMDRCNPTIIVEPGYAWVAPFLAEYGVEVIASLPCYSADNVDAQRGKGVFEASVAALAQLNALGYGQSGSELVLNLVYNPVAPVLPPEQHALEADYRHFLGDRFGLSFNNLFTIANMPIKRYSHWLLREERFAEYMTLLKDAYRADNLANVMCRSLISVDWQGHVYDCDFNQMLSLPIGGSAPVHLAELVDADLAGAPIAVDDHCFGCTAGQGSSCGGALN